MKIVRNIKVPTGNIIIASGDLGLLEFLSIGDYGKEKNIKASFLGLDREIDGVPHGDLLPLEEKWVITVSTQYGCSMGCTFCDVPKVGKGRNVTTNDLLDQIRLGVKLHPEVDSTKRLNVHYARMGEPTFNTSVLIHARILKEQVGYLLPNSLVHPVVSTMMPKKNKHLPGFLMDWCSIKNNLYEGDAGLQISINSTDDDQRAEMFGGSALSLTEISRICSYIEYPIGRKYALNFALADGYIIDPVLLAELFSPDKFMIKITPMHITNSCDENQIHTSGGYEYFTPYKDIEDSLKSHGFDVIVFIPSIEEDESRITCGNAILSSNEFLS